MTSLGPFKVGDSPAHPITLDLESRDDLAPYAQVKARLLGPSGGLVADLGTSNIVAPDMLATFAFPADPFTVRGLYTLAAKLVGGSKVKALDPILVIVEADDGWHTLATARESWSTSLPDLRLAELLEIARLQVTLYAVGTPARGSTALRAAQLMQARNILNASKADPSADESGFVIQPYPLDRFVRELIRPRRAVGRVG